MSTTYDYCKSAKIFDWNKILSLISKIKLHLMGLNLTVICRITLVEKIYILIGFDLAVNGMVINKLTYYQNYPHMPYVQLMYIHTLSYLKACTSCGIKNKISSCKL